MSVRTREQLAVLVKLVEVNSKSLTHRHFDERQKVWRIITEKLNAMRGAQKDIESWKRSYHTWRMSTGKNYESEVQRILSNVHDDEYFHINITDDDEEFESEHDANTEMNTKNPTETQNMRLHELIEKQKDMLISNADDEPLKERIWLNIADELNAIPGGLQLPSDEWKTRVDWNPYVTKKRGPSGRKRKSTFKPQTIVKRSMGIKSSGGDIESIEFEILDNETVNSQSSSNSSDISIDSSRMVGRNPYSASSDASNYSSLMTGMSVKSKKAMIAPANNTEQQKLTLQSNPPKENNFKTEHISNASIDAALSRTASADHNINADHFTENRNVNEADDDLEMLDNEIDFNSADDYDVDDEQHDVDGDLEFASFNPKHKRIKATPLVKSFKYKNHILNAMTDLNSNVDDMKRLLKTTTTTLTSLESLMQQQCKKQDETNAILKRNAQLLKILVEFKTGRRSSK